MWLVWKPSGERHQNLQSGARILSIIYHGMICKLSPGILKVSTAQSLRGCSMLSSCSARKSECYIHRHKHALLDVHFESARWDQWTVVLRRESYWWETMSALLGTNEFTESRLWDGAKGRTVSAGSIVYIAIVIQQICDQRALKSQKLAVIWYGRLLSSCFNV